MTSAEKTKLAPPRRILMTTDTVGGVFSYALELCAELARHGVSVALATMGPVLSRKQREELAALDNVALHESQWKLEWMSEPWEDVRRAGEWLLELEARVEPDCVHLNGYAHGSLPFRAKRLVVGHSCVLSWWEAVRKSPLPARFERYREQAQAGLAAADLVVAPSHAMLASLAAHYGPLPLSRVIPNGARLDAIPTRTKELRVVSAGRLWDEAKNIGALTALGPHLSWPVHVAGDTDGPDGSSFVGSGVRMLGKLSRRALLEELAAASVAVFPARYEPFGLTVLEAAAARCALVLGDIPSLRENWSGAACFVDPDDAHALSRAIERLMRDPGSRRELAQRARRRALELGVETMGQSYVSAYAELGARTASLPTEVRCA